MKLTNGNAQAHDLFVTGYDVSDNVKNDDSPIEGVNLLLFSHKTVRIKYSRKKKNLNL